MSGVYLTEIITTGSRWTFNPESKMYRRTTLDGLPRRNPKWSQGPLKDGMWHPYVEYAIHHNGCSYDNWFGLHRDVDHSHLHIMIDDEGVRTLCTAPEPRLINAGTRDPALCSLLSERAKIVAGFNS